LPLRLNFFSLGWHSKEMERNHPSSFTRSVKSIHIGSRCEQGRGYICYF
jgi:hypothetical protein